MTRQIRHIRRSRKGKKFTAGKRITKRTANRMIKDEREAIRYYQKIGLLEFSKDEAKHLAYWKKVRRVL